MTPSTQVAHEVNRQSESHFIFYFIHGWGSCPESYKTSLSALEDLGFDIHTPTLPGHAKVPHLPRRKRALLDVSRHLSKTVTPINDDKHIVFAGHSLGGVIATHLCQEAVTAGKQASLLLLSPAGANPVFGPKEWIRAFSDLRQERPKIAARTQWRLARNFLLNSVRTSRLGWEARNSDYREGWRELIARGVHVTAVHASNDRVVDTRPLLSLDGAQQVTIPRPHDWPTWDPQTFSTIARLHMQKISANKVTALK